MTIRLLELLQPLLIDRQRKPSLSLPLVSAPFFFGPRPGEPTPSWIDTGRTRPRYFDGRFLAARDLERDQAYIAARQAEYLRAAGPGVIHVRNAPSPAATACLAIGRVIADHVVERFLPGEPGLPRAAREPG